MIRKLFSALVAVLPFAIVGGLLYAALFVKVEPAVRVVPRPLIEARDRFFGVAQADGALWAVGSGGKVLHSDDGGQHWQAQAAGTGETLQAVAAWDRRHVVIGGEGLALRHSADGGATWQAARLPDDISASRILRLRAFADGLGFAAADYGLLLHSDDFGANWNIAHQGEDVTWNDVALAGGTALAVGEFGHILRSVDGGQTWEAVESPAERSLTSVAFLSGEPLRAIAVGLNGLVLESRDAGATWTPQPEPTNEHLFSLVAQGDRWLAVGDKGIWVRGDGNSAHVFRSSGIDMRWRTDLAAVDNTRVLASGVGLCLLDASATPETAACASPCASADACPPSTDATP